MMEGLEQRQLLAGDSLVPVVDVPNFTTGPRNVGEVQAFAFHEAELTDQAGLNDSIVSARLCSLRT